MKIEPTYVDVSGSRRAASVLKQVCQKHGWAIEMEEDDSPGGYTYKVYDPSNGYQLWQALEKAKGDKVSCWITMDGSE